MMEPLFGSGSPFATGTPVPGLGWFQPPISLANRPPMSTGTPGFGVPPSITLVPQNMPQIPISQEAYAYGSGMTAGGQPGFAGQAVGPSPFGVPGGVAGFVVPEVTTPQGLLAAVALRRGQPMGPTNDQEIEDFMYDALEFLPGSNEVEVRCEGGRATLTGNVPHRRLKRDVGEIAWTIPTITDVQNNVTITARRRIRGVTREAEAQQTAAAGRKQG